MTIRRDERRNDIFFVGDTHQRIYKKKAVLSKCGINIRGRSSNLRLNYRTTEETRKYAFAILKDMPFDNLDGEYEAESFCQSLTHGDYPKIMNFKTINDEIEYIVNEINTLTKNGVQLKDICLVARTQKFLADYKRELPILCSISNKKSYHPHPIALLSNHLIIVKPICPAVIPRDSLIRSKLIYQQTARIGLVRSMSILEHFRDRYRDICMGAL
ncbi:MAG: hypothetical protein FWF88_03145 [Peptococcaceae bacterium]|nr:hypothetical protein [Peptococcaceae bacterium]